MTFSTFSLCRGCTTSANQGPQDKNFLSPVARRCLIACAVATAVSCVFIVLGACHQFSPLGNTLAIAHGSFVLIMALGSVIANLRSRTQHATIETQTLKKPSEAGKVRKSRSSLPPRSSAYTQRTQIQSNTTNTAPSPPQPSSSSSMPLACTGTSGDFRAFDSTKLLHCEITEGQIKKNTGDLGNPNAHLILTLERTYQEAQNVADKAVAFVNQELNVPDITHLSEQERIIHLNKYCPLVFQQFRLYENKLKAQQAAHPDDVLCYRAYREDLEKCLQCLYVYINWIVLSIKTKASLMDEEQKLAYWSQHTTSTSALIKNIRYMMERLFVFKEGCTWDQDKKKWVRGEGEKHSKLLRLYAPYFNVRDGNTRNTLKKLCLATLRIVDQHCPPDTINTVFKDAPKGRRREDVETRDQLLYF